MTGRSAQGLGMDDIKPELLSRFDELMRALGVDISQNSAKRKGTYYHMRSPLPGRKDANPSFLLRHSGSHKGVWKDMSSGEGGGIFHLIIAMGLAGDMRDALNWAKGFLGYSNEGVRVDKREIERRRRENERLAKERADQEARILAQKRRDAKKLWLSLEKSLLGTVAQTYLMRDRGIDLTKFGRQPAALRFAPELAHRPTGEIRPAIVALMSGPDGSAYAIHRTWLKPDGSAKADFGREARMVWPDCAGSVIRLNKGITLKSPEKASERVLKGDADAAGPVLLCEGIEDGLSLMWAKPEHRIWAAYSLGNLANVPDMPCISEYVVCPDNDWNNPGALKGLASAYRHLKQSGKPVKKAPASYGKDANDVLRAGLH